MGTPDVIIVNCPICGNRCFFESKSGPNLMLSYNLKDVPDDILQNANRHSPYKCRCGNYLEIDIQNREVRYLKVPRCEECTNLNIYEDRSVDMRSPFAQCSLGFKIKQEYMMGKWIPACGSCDKFNEGSPTFY